MDILNKQNRIKNGAWGIEEDRELSQVLRERARQKQEIVRSYQDLLNWVEKWKKRNNEIWPEVEIQMREIKRVLTIAPSQIGTALIILAIELIW